MVKSLIISTSVAIAALAGSAAVAQNTPPAAQSPESQVPPAGTAPAAPGAVSVKASDTVYDTAGNSVGTIESVEGANAVLSTGTVKVQIPVSAIAQGPKGPTIGVTKAEVEAQVKKGAPQP